METKGVPILTEKIRVCLVAVMFVLVVMMKLYVGFEGWLYSIYGIKPLIESWLVSHKKERFPAKIAVVSWTVYVYGDTC